MPNPKDPIDFVPPLRRGWFGVRSLTVNISRWRMGEVSPIDVDQLSFGIDVPDDLRPGGEVIGPLEEHLRLGGGAVVVLASNFHC